MADVPCNIEQQAARKTTVVNVKVQHLRPRYQNLQEWMLDDDHIYIGRKGVVFIDGKRFPAEDSLFCNPFRLGPASKGKRSRSAAERGSSDVRNRESAERDQVVERYRQYMVGKLRDGTISRAAFEALRGKVLGCWCAPLLCHGHVLAELLDSPSLFDEVALS
mmetsp:Transcript_32436/g.71662  ORF Transcript_32436/g.71662 Transcript_32436/m.71662 type:complete len:163 (+) Transcript_32436:84-572(+)